MCGLIGFLGGEERSKNSGEEVLRQMALKIQHRGPDDHGVWYDSNGKIGLGHRRLSILDLSPAGHQPMESRDQRFIVVYNGEIYNHEDLRAEIQRVNPREWKGHSDTETLLAGFEIWGIKATIERAIGMFAIAVWDKEAQVLSLVRDRMGEKPLYYGWVNGSFVFGSELKGLKAFPNFQKEIDRQALCLYLRHNYIPAPHSIYKGISKLLPGYILNISPKNSEPVLECYWSLESVIHNGAANRFAGTPEHAVNELEKTIKEALSRQMIADVPLGAFLSGGIDSSTVVALMQSQSSRPTKTFSIGFNVPGFNEAEFAKAVATHLGTEHTEMYVDSQDALNVIPLLPQLYDEPFSDSSQIPTFLVSKLARTHVTVALSGDAGDELFCGYNRYQVTNQTWKKLSQLPVGVRKGLSKAMRSVSPETWAKTMKYLPIKNRFQNIGDKIHKAADVMSSHSSRELYKRLVSHHLNPADLVIGAMEPTTPLDRDLFQDLNDVEMMMALDMMTYLPDDILVKVDRAAMGVSLETRVPFLDHKVIELAWKLPLSLKLREGQSKWVLRQILYKYVPRELIERPKMGFGVPLDDWLRGPLKEWAESLLDSKRISQEGFFRPEKIQALWSEHKSGKRNWAYLLWDILMFQAWLEAQG